MSRLARLALPCVCAPALLLVAGAPARAEVILYQNTFESGVVGPYWSASAHIESHAAFSKYVGRYAANESVVLSPPVPPAEGTIAVPPGGTTSGGEYRLYTLTFDFYAIDSWDGSATNNGPDWYKIWVNGRRIFAETFANTHPSQTFRAPDVGPTNLGYNAAWPDSIYRQIRVDFTLLAGETTMAIRFAGENLQELNDESWGIDNIKVAYQVVPTPATTALGVLGLGLASGRRRRR